MDAARAPTTIYLDKCAWLLARAVREVHPEGISVRKRDFAVTQVGPLVRFTSGIPYDEKPYWNLDLITSSGLSREDIVRKYENLKRGLGDDRRGVTSLAPLSQRCGGHHLVGDHLGSAGLFHSGNRVFGALRQVARALHLGPRIAWG